MEYWKEFVIYKWINNNPQWFDIQLNKYTKLNQIHQMNEILVLNNTQWVYIPLNKYLVGWSSFMAYQPL